MHEIESAQHLKPYFNMGCMVVYTRIKKYRAHPTQYMARRGGERGSTYDSSHPR